ncbi:MAG: DUF2723 domain-containing protein, partial [Actinomycetota bacterium]|nr:DUF2723 domain-containing protein [Actinomycetota bacterium]
MRLPPARLIWPLLVAAGLGAAYATTLLPDVGYETDTAKFDYLGRVLGTGHPPGYPLYTLLNAVFVRVLPVGTLAFRANLLSAVLAVGAGLLLYGALVELHVRRPVAAVGATVFGLTRSLWSQAIVAEVYALHLVFVAAVLLLLLRWRRSRADRDLLLAVGLYGLSFSHHLSTALLAPGVAWFVLRTDPRVLTRWRLLVAACAVAMAGLLPYLYLFWRSTDPGLAYAEVRVTDLPSFWAAFTGGGYRQHMFAFGPRAMLTERLALFGGLLRQQPLLPALPFAAWGLLRLRGRPVAGLLLAWAVINTVWAMGYDVSDVHVFFVPTYLVVVAWATVGADALVTAVPERLEVAATALLLTAPLGLLWANHATVDLSDDPTAAGVRAALDHMAGGGVVFTYHFHHFNYFLTGLGLRADHAVYPLYPEPFQRIAMYCAGAVALDVPHVGVRAPPGLPVYAYGQGYVERLRAAGLTVTPVLAELSAVH